MAKKKQTENCVELRDEFTEDSISECQNDFITSAYYSNQPVRDTMIFRRSWYETIEKVSETSLKVEMCMALFDYAFYGICPEHASTCVRVFFETAKPLIDKDIWKYENSRKYDNFEKRMGLNKMAAKSRMAEGLE